MKLFKHRHHYEQVALTAIQYKEMMAQLQDIPTYPWYKKCRCGKTITSVLSIAVEER